MSLPVAPKRICRLSRHFHNTRSSRQQFQCAFQGEHASKPEEKNIPTSNFAVKACWAKVSKSNNLCWRWIVSISLTLPTRCMPNGRWLSWSLWKVSTIAPLDSSGFCKSIELMVQPCILQAHRMPTSPCASRSARATFNQLLFTRGVFLEVDASGGLCRCFIPAASRMPRKCDGEIYVAVLWR
jgi:hypothetical protein